MSKVKDTLKRILPAPVLHFAADTLNAVRRSNDWPAATFHPWRRDTVSRLALLKDKYRGERCFIIGNGPSLRNTDLSKLKDEYTFGLNRIYLMFPELGFKTTFLLSVNDLVIEQCAAEIQALPIPKFVSWRSRTVLQPADDLYFLYTTYTGAKFSKDARGRLWEGATVTYAALQVAFFMGFEKVILIGVDHNFATKGQPNTTVVSQGDDPNHFAPGYFGKGFRWQLPDLETSEIAYRMAREAYEKDGRQVLDATIGGKLTVFPKVPYDSLF
ncbi:MAG TPA: 6-hydroxymethylpterin diphosphokinase MptE-like protein [Longilinea sp.]|nr:6-hydroxymethylpterin diphosphokinase MptE-like protein [Longilinea sp.]